MSLNKESPAINIFFFWSNVVCLEAIEQLELFLPSCFPAFADFDFIIALVFTIELIDDLLLHVCLGLLFSFNTWAWSV